MSPDTQHLVTVTHLTAGEVAASSPALHVGALIVMVATAAAVRMVMPRLGRWRAAAGCLAAGVMAAAVFAAAFLSVETPGPDREALRADVVAAYDLDARALPVKTVGRWEPPTTEGAVTAGWFLLRSTDGRTWPAGSWFTVGEGDGTFWLATLDGDHQLVVLGHAD